MPRFHVHFKFFKERNSSLFHFFFARFSSPLEQIGDGSLLSLLKVTSFISSPPVTTAYSYHPHLLIQFPSFLPVFRHLPSLLHLYFLSHLRWVTLSLQFSGVEFISHIQSHIQITHEYSNLEKKRAILHYWWQINSNCLLHIYMNCNHFNSNVKRQINSYCKYLAST